MQSCVLRDTYFPWQPFVSRLFSSKSLPTRFPINRFSPRFHLASEISLACALLLHVSPVRCRFLFQSSVFVSRLFARPVEKKSLAQARFSRLFSFHNGPIVVLNLRDDRPYVWHLLGELLAPFISPHKTRLARNFSPIYAPIICQDVEPPLRLLLFVEDSEHLEYVLD